MVPFAVKRKTTTKQVMTFLIEFADFIISITDRFDEEIHHQ
ncbi:hypothetical protein [Mucilaginibacter antarcticus]|uniref:Uncharacterized protein n=1 Tax=Mucilaginibacter antarcticus TaxID=1855725 RepID=A0ABW5XJN6_9SPHI